MQLPFLLLVNLLYTGCFEQCVAAFRRVRLKERAFLKVSSTDVDVMLRDVVHCQPLCLVTLLGSILSELERKRTMFNCHIDKRIVWVFQITSFVRVCLPSVWELPAFPPWVGWGIFHASGAAAPRQTRQVCMCGAHCGAASYPECILLDWEHWWSPGTEGRRTLSPGRRSRCPAVASWLS